MRVYFNLVDCAGTIPDQQGVEVLNLQQAYTEVAEMLQQDAELKANVGGWRLDAVNASGAVLFSIDLDRVVPSPWSRITCFVVWLAS
jgi:hypothetical protein